MRSKTYSYKVITKTGTRLIYSGQFKEKEKAEEWYDCFGKWLEIKFNRKLILTESSIVDGRSKINVV